MGDIYQMIFFVCLNQVLYTGYNIHNISDFNISVLG